MDTYAIARMREVSKLLFDEYSRIVFVLVWRTAVSKDKFECEMYCFDLCVNCLILTKEEGISAILFSLCSLLCFYTELANLTYFVSSSWDIWHSESRNLSWCSVQAADVPISETVGNEAKMQCAVSCMLNTRCWPS